MKDEDDYVKWSKWKEWCNQWEESKKGRETFLTKDNTDKYFVDNSNMSEELNYTAINSSQQICSEKSIDITSEIIESTYSTSVSWT